MKAMKAMKEMKAIIVDDERLSLQYMRNCMLEVRDVLVVECFQDVLQALAFARENPIDIVLLDIEMPNLTGMEAAKEFRKISPNIGIIFVTGYEEYALEAFRLDAVDYITKPCTSQMIQKAIAKATKLLSATEKKRIYIKTFGYFTVYVDREVVSFTNQKAKELLAILVDRECGQVTMEQITYILWENRPYDHMVKQLYRKAVTYLNHMQSELGIEIFVSNRGICNLISSYIDCDYFQLLAGSQEAIRNFDGSYMLDYSWAEETTGKICKLLNYY